MRTLLGSIAIVVMAACGGADKSAATTPGNDTEPASDTAGDPPLTDPGEGEPRSEEECGALLDHMQSVVSEAIDREGMMTGCLEEWSDDQVACFQAAASDDDVAACW